MLRLCLFDSLLRPGRLDPWVSVEESTLKPSPAVQDHPGVIHLCHHAFEIALDNGGIRAEVGISLGMKCTERTVEKNLSIFGCNAEAVAWAHFGADSVGAQSSSRDWLHPYRNCRRRRCEAVRHEHHKCYMYVLHNTQQRRAPSSSQGKRIIRSNRKAPGPVKLATCDLCRKCRARSGRISSSQEKQSNL